MARQTEQRDPFASFEFAKELPRALRAQAIGGDPVATRRRKMIEAIERERDFWQHPEKLNAYEGKRKPSTWIKRQGTDCYITPRYGVRPLELRPGMPVVKVHMEQVGAFLDALRQATENGQLDEKLGQLAERTAEVFREKAA